MNVLINGGRSVDGSFWNLLSYLKSSMQQIDVPKFYGKRLAILLREARCAVNRCYDR